MYYRLIQQMINSLNGLKKIIEKAQAHQDANDVNLLEGRLAPDMFHFIRQIQAVSDTSKFAAARLCGKDAPSYEDTEETYEELYERLDKTITYLKTFTEEDFEGAATRKITIPPMPQVWATGDDYFCQFALPNFYFHYTTAYGILRHMGLEVGKRDFLGTLNLRPHEQ